MDQNTLDTFTASTAAVAAIAFGVHVVSVSVAARRQKMSDRPPAAPGSVPPVTVIRPLRGVEPFSYVALHSTFTLKPSAAEILFCVESSNDPIIPIVERLIAKNPDQPARLLVGKDRIGANPKLNNMAKGWRAAAHDWVAFIDSNVVLPERALSALFSKADPQTGMVCSPPAGSDPVGFAARLECAFLNSYQARWQSTADTAGFGFAQGKVMLFPRAVLDRAGGLVALASEPAEDAAATKAIRAQGLKIRLVDRFFEQPLGMRTLVDVWQRQVRWARLRRASFPICYASEILTGIVVPALATAIACASVGIPILPAVLALGAVWYGLEHWLARCAGWPPQSPLIGLVRDLMLPALWVQGWLSREFEWHGHRLAAERPTSRGSVSAA
jgi:ceramide glucosyltransferase